MGEFNLTLLCFLHTVDRLNVVEQSNNTLTLWFGITILYVSFNRDKLYTGFIGIDLR